MKVLPHWQFFIHENLSVVCACVHVQFPAHFVPFSQHSMDSFDQSCCLRLTTQRQHTPTKCTVLAMSCKSIKQGIAHIIKVTKEISLIFGGFGFHVHVMKC